MTEQIADTSAPRRRRGSRRRRRRRLVRAILATCGSLAAVSLVLALVVSAFVLNVAKSFDGRTQTITHAFPQGHRPAGGPGLNVLMIGSDSRAGTDQPDAGNVAGGRSDVLMLVHLDEQSRAAYVMSILRDSWVDVPGHGMAKINAAYSWGGVPLTVQTVESLVGVRIDHVAEIDFTGFAGMTKALGGVDVRSSVAFDGRGHHFIRGENRLDGDAALAFVRERYAFADGDHQRVKNQQAFVRGVVDALISRETLSDPRRLADFIEVTADHLSVDPGLTASRVAEIGWRARGMTPSALHTFTMPTSGGGLSADGQSYVEVNPFELQQLRDALRADRLGSYPTAVGR